MPLLNRFCCCMSLRTGTIVCGVLSLISTVLTEIVILVNSVKVKTIVWEDLSPLVVKIILSLILGTTLVVAILLIVGAVKRRPWFLLPYIVLSIIYAIALPISVIYTTVEFFINNHVEHGIISIIFGLFAVGFHIYLWLVVFSFYQLVTEEKNRGPYTTPMYNSNAYLRS